MTSAAALSFVHEFVRATAEEAPTLLLLHGTGGDERDLLPIGRALDPSAALLSPRGRVREGGARRFFHRLAEGVFDLHDLAVRTDELADFVVAAAHTYGFDAARVIAVGYSNGANIAASVLLRRPRVLAGAILFRPMVPFEPTMTPDLHHARVLIASGQHDLVVPSGQPERLREVLTAAGATVQVHWHPGGHELGEDDLATASRWLSGVTGDR
jgi:phospholipase/carboxylesterase